MVKFDFQVSRIGEVTMSETHTPVGALKQRVVFAGSPPGGRRGSWSPTCVGNWISQRRQDVEIWKRKICRQRPLWAAADGPLGQMRAWYCQSYPQNLIEGSPRGNHGGG